MDDGRRFAHIILISNLVLLLVCLLVTFVGGARLPVALTITAANAIIPLIYLTRRRYKGDF